MFNLNKISILFIILISIVASGFIYEKIARANSHKLFQPSGLLINIGDRVIHLDCRGSGSPTVVLESGLDTLGAQSWSAIHDTLASKARTCAYDRAGLMWSEPRRLASDLLKEVAIDLNKTLEVAGIKPPYVLVGHSYGGPYITKYTELYPKKVKGIVFIDSPHPEQMSLVKDIEVSFLDSVQQTTYEFIIPILDDIGFTRIMNSSNSFSFPNQPRDSADVVKEFFSVSNKALSIEIENYEKGLEQLNHFRDFDDRPMYVLANIVNYRDMSDEQLTAAGLNRELVDAVMEQDLYMFNDQVSWSSNGKLELLHDTSHYIQFEKPEKVISAIEWVIEEVRNETNSEIL